MKISHKVNLLKMSQKVNFAKKIGQPVVYPRLKGLASKSPRKYQTEAATNKSIKDFRKKLPTEPSGFSLFDITPATEEE